LICAHRESVFVVDAVVDVGQHGFHVVFHQFVRDGSSVVAEIAIRFTHASEFRTFPFHLGRARAIDVGAVDQRILLPIFG